MMRALCRQRNARVGQLSHPTHRRVTAATSFMTAPGGWVSVGAQGPKWNALLRSTECGVMPLATFSGIFPLLCPRPVAPKSPRQEQDCRYATQRPRQAPRGQRRRCRCRERQRTGQQPQQPKERAPREGAEIRKIDRLTRVHESRVPKWARPVLDAGIDLTTEAGRLDAVRRCRAAVTSTRLRSR
jgi:hypothetical protein